MDTYIKQYPQFPYVLYILDIGIKGNINIYFSIIESGNDNIEFLHNKWSICLNEDINFETVVKGFKKAKTNAPSVFQHFKQYKLLHRRTLHN